MRPALRLTLLVLAVPTLFAQELAYQPKPGTQWMRTHQSKVQLQFDAIHLSINGLESDASGMKVALKSENTVQVQDSILAWETKGKRSFERDYLQVTRTLEAPLEVQVGEETVRTTMEAKAEGALQGQRIMFDFTPETSDWSRSFAEEALRQTESRGLEVLTSDLDMTCLLPPAGSKEGATWKVEAGPFLAALMADQGMEWNETAEPAQDLPLWIGSLAHQPSLLDLWTQQDHVRIECTLKPRRKLGRKNLQEIFVKVSIGGSADLTDWAMDTLASARDKNTQVTIKNAYQATLMTGSGVYLWDLDRRVMHSFRYHGEAKFTRGQSILVQSGEEDFDVRMECDGSFEIDVHAEASR